MIVEKDSTQFTVQLCDRMDKAEYFRNIKFQNKFFILLVIFVLRVYYSVEYDHNKLIIFFKEGRLTF